jgi:triacylglycerol lipase
MGVTFTRRVLKGGKVNATNMPIDLGPPLTDRVDTFVGIAGGNWGISNCAINFYDFFKVCNNKTGFHPGNSDATPFPNGLSAYLLELNSDPTREAQHTFAILSLYDQVVTPISYSRYTSEYPTMDASYKFTSEEYDHITVKDFTFEM